MNHSWTTQEIGFKSGKKWEYVVIRLIELEERPEIFTVKKERKLRNVYT